MTKLIGAVGDLVVEGNNLYRTREQEIGDDFFEHLRSQKEDRIPLADNMMVCSVPQVLIDTWMAQGFDFWKADPKTICDRLRAEGYERFITGS